MIKILLASPGDVDAERVEVRKVIEERGAASGVEIDIVEWRHDEDVPEAPPVPDAFDMVLCLFGTRVDISTPSLSRFPVNLQRPRDDDPQTPKPVLRLYIPISSEGAWTNQFIASLMAARSEILRLYESRKDLQRQVRLDVDQFLDRIPHAPGSANLRLSIENVANLPDGGPLTFEIRGQRGIDIGRSPYLDWVLPDPDRLVSSTHCEIRYEGGGYLLRDVSRNGTFVNQNPLTDVYRLRDGDRIEIGHYIIRVDVLDGPTTDPERVMGDEGPVWDFDALRPPVPAAARRKRPKDGLAISPVPLGSIGPLRSVKDIGELTKLPSPDILEMLVESPPSILPPTTVDPSEVIGSRGDTVEASAFAPGGAPSGGKVMVQVFLHQCGEAVVALAQAADPDASSRGSRVLSMRIEKGQKVGIVVDAGGLAVDDASQVAVWNGSAISCQFLVTMAGPAGLSHHVCVRVYLQGIPVGKFLFVLKVFPSSTEAAIPAQVAEVAQRYRHAFLSYAAEDRLEVLKRAQMLNATGVAFFQDILSLKPGEEWKTRLMQEIDRCDVFLLFWSSHAAASEWVKWETVYASERHDAHRPDIVPLILEGPPVPAPPPALAHIHFNDSLRYVIAAIELTEPRP